MNQVNYQKELDKLLEGLERDRASGLAAPSLFLHSCCAPCSSYVLEYLCPYFRITVFYYNPNISLREEYGKRMEEQKRLIGEYNRRKLGYEIAIQEGKYEPERFFEMAQGLEDCPEGGERCFRCYALRLSETAAQAKKAGSDYFCTTLSISPLKNARKINEIGRREGERYGVAWLPSDFKKKDGYKRSIQLSAEYGLYRQNYCGCAFSVRERDLERYASGSPTGGTGGGRCGKPENTACGMEKSRV
ncbi:MAG: epoxyqueuosine reductase QueH [Roseburia sp.]|nr:epoxyqueuosine reductase QueH [Roseburia sp.]MCM1097053.1 epoxyqueuosine reductase QueH [Ruminococcus flavefaciens]